MTHDDPQSDERPVRVSVRDWSRWPADRLMQFCEVAEVLGVSEITVARYIHRRYFEVVCLPSGTRRVRKGDLLKFIRRHRGMAKRKPRKETP